MEDEILGAAAVKDRDGIYCIGSFGRIVNFSAQQCRALNLVWALHERHKIVPGGVVAVIGSGMTGVTVAAGLISSGYKVDLFESKRELLPKQLNTDHRLVHPTINRWPLVAPSLTTNFPFLEWYAGTCSTVTKDLTQQFKNIYDAGECRIFKEYTVIDISDPATNLYQLSTKPAVDAPSAYSAVIIAMGFGDEHTDPAFKTISYWRPDDLEDTRLSTEIEQFVVSGCGDGGLIDALRIVHREFDKGLLAFETAVALYGTPIAIEIETAERSAASVGDPKDLKAVYTSVVEKLRTLPEYAATANRLKESLNAFTGIVYLADSILPTLFSLSSAPIHKLMIEHARQEARIKFSHGSPERVGGSVVLDGRPFPDLPMTHVVIRNGAKEPAFGQLLTRSEKDDLKSKQLKLDDRFITPQWKNAFRDSAHGTPFDPKSQAFIQSRLVLANRAIRTISQDATVVPLVDGFQAQYPGAVPTMAPDQFFGIPTISKSVPAGKGL